MLITMVVLLMLGALEYSGALKRLEWITEDARAKLLRKEKALHPDIEVILIDEASLQAMDPLLGRWPWPRWIWADLINFLSMGEPRAIVFDVLFSESGEGDETFAEAMKAQGNVYLATQFFKEASASEGKPVLYDLPEGFKQQFAVKALEGFEQSPEHHRAADTALLPKLVLWEAATGIGVVTVWADDDGMYRRIRPVVFYHDDPFWALSLTALQKQIAAPRRTDDTVETTLGSLPVDSEGFYHLYAYGKSEPYSIAGIFSSLQQVYAGNTEKLLVHPEEFRGKIVFIGASAIGLADLKPTAMSPLTPGVILHATALSNLLDGETLKPAAGWVNLLNTMVLIAAVTWMVLYISRLFLQIAIPLLLGSGFIVVALSGYEMGYLVSMAFPLSGMLLAWLSALFYLSITEGRDKKRVRMMLGQYVSPAILANVVDHYQDQLKAEVGQEEDMTILFADIRSFTSLSEKLTAVEVVEMLNIYFDAMVDIIFDHKGTLDKFIGDAIMAFWGAPVKDDLHAKHAVLAAVHMIRRLEDVNMSLYQQGFPSLRIGVGLNTGEVILGNIGSSKKLDYTVIGDTVNLASRSEGLTGKYGCLVIITQFTLEQLAEEFHDLCTIVDKVAVKGKKHAVSFYEVLALPEDSDAIKQKGLDEGARHHGW